MKARPNGFTLLEVAVAATILFVVMSMAYLLLFASSNEYANQTVHLALDERARDVLADMVRELQNAQDPPTPESPLQPSDPGYDPGKPFCTELAFRTISRFDYASRAPVFGNQVRYRWILESGETANGMDDNGNGLVDEGAIEKTETLEGRPAVRSVICRDVACKGLRFLPGNGSVSITLELQRRDARDTLVSRKAATTAQLRN